MSLKRILQMPVNEVVERTRQEAAKLLDRVAAENASLILPDRVKLRTVDLRARNGGDPEHLAADLLDQFRARTRRHFFEGLVWAETAARFLERIPQSRDQILSSADAVCRGRFDLMGYRALSFGVPVDWHLDPLSDRRTPLIHWSRFRRFDPAQAGDCKLVWELNRHQWLLYLGQAYRFTGDERYVDAFIRYVGEWMRANPRGMGVNWASSLEVAFRLISWCWTLALCEGSRTVSAGLCADVLAGIESHARHVERYLSYYSSPNTHLTGEALGLLYAGILLPESRSTRRWQALAAQILVDQCERQILADGVYFEQSTCYQRYTAEMYLHFLILADRNGIRVPETVAHRVQRMLDFLVAIRRPDGSMPQIGDADNGWLLPLVPRDPGDLRGVLSVAAAFFGRSDYAWAAGGLTPEVLWLLGSRGAGMLETLVPTPPPTAPSQLFPEGGYVVMRSGWERGAHQLVFDVGPLGCPISGAHGHADLLGIQCVAFGEPYLVDPGIYAYSARPQWLDFFRSTAAHSTVRVDGVEQAVPAGPFKWQARPRARLRRWLSTPGLEFADAEHDAYGRLADPVTHRRGVVFVRSSYWVLIDDLDGRGEHQVELRFQFAPIEVHVDSTLWARARSPGRKGFLIHPFSNVPLQASVRRGDFAPIAGWVSEEYGRREPAPLLVYSAAMTFPLRIVTLLLPTSDPQAPAPAVAPLLSKGGMPVGVVFDDGESVYFSDQGVPVMTPRRVRTER